MTKHSIIPASILALGLGIIGHGAQAEVLFSGSEIQLHYGDGFHLGANGLDSTTRTTLTFEQYTLFNWGDLFYFVDLNKDHQGTGSENSHYAEAWLHLSGKAMGLTFPDGAFVKDVGPDFGINHGEDFLVIAPGVRADLNVSGFSVLTAGAYVYKNVDDPFDRDLDTTYQITFVWDYPFKIGNENLSIRGFADFIGEQGNGFESQIVFSPQLRWDVGKEGGTILGLEYTYYKNKYGVNDVDDTSVSVFAALKF